MIRERWYKRKGSTNQNTRLHEVEAEYPDGDLHHYFVLKSIDEVTLDIPKELKSKYFEAPSSRSKIMEFLFRYYQNEYYDIAYQKDVEYLSISSVLFCYQISDEKYTRHSKSRFANTKPSDFEDSLCFAEQKGCFQI